jgi:hypothetical protein
MNMETRINVAGIREHGALRGKVGEDEST